MIGKTGRCTYGASFSEEDQTVGTVLKFPSLSWLDPVPSDAPDGIFRLVEKVIGDMVRSGEKIPEPLNDRKYSGKLTLRLTP